MNENMPETKAEPESDGTGPELLTDIPPKYAPIDEQPYDRRFGLRLATPV